ncbi:MAG: hypothetical protein CMQ24_18730 [Gammaproteobacteria bacterium]|nr:hypothetical protein [Gammaproteobacteria bacterium]
MSEFAIDAAWLQVEITEHSIIEDAESARAVLTALADKGVSIAVDDFGTGYSSLRYLVELSGRFPENRSVVRKGRHVTQGGVHHSVRLCAVAQSRADVYRGGYRD